MVPTATTYRLLSRSVDMGARAGETVVDPHSLGLEFDDPRGYLRSEHVQMGPDELLFSRITSTTYQARMGDPDYFTFVRQGSGRYDLQIGGRHYGMLPGSLLAFRPNEREVRVATGKSGVRAATTVQVPVARMQTLAQAFETTVGNAFPQDGNAVRGQSGITLARVMAQLSGDLFGKPTAAVPARVAQETQHLVEEILGQMFGRPEAATSTRRIFPAFHRVRQAEAMMHEHSDEPLSILQIAEALGVTPRSLQLAFEYIHEGQSPRAVLTRIRLEKARRRLTSANGEGQVTDIAMQSGFFHLGRFAQTYARTFGERPSETLNRRRG